MTIYILFGEMGVGKNYIGEKLAEHLDCYFFDGDEALPPALKEKVSNFKSLTLDEIEDFVRDDLIPEVEAMAGKAKPCGCGCGRDLGGDMVVGQALYRADHRKIIAEYFGSRVEWIYIEPPSFFTHMKRLLSRRRGIRWMLLGLASKAFFQKPPSNTFRIKSVDGVSITDAWKNQ